MTFGVLTVFLSAWMALCCFCGLKSWYIWFVAVLIGGLALHLLWLVFGVGASAVDPNTQMALGSGVIFALFAFAIGRFLGRVLQAWRDSRV